MAGPITWSSVGNAIKNVSGVFGDVFGGASNALGGLVSGLFNSREAQANRDWQEQMSNTAHQREVADLRKAGLNPILTATGGNGASSPTGGQGVMQPLDFASGQQANTQKRLGRKNESNIDADTNIKRMQWSLTHEQEQNEFERRANIIADREFTTANTAKTLQDIENSKTLTNAQALNLLYGSEAQKTSAAAAMKGSIAASTNAQAAMINATTGSVPRIIMNEVKSLKGVNKAYKWLHK